MRVTDSMKYTSSIANLDATSSSLQRATQVATTGQNIIDPSDNPSGWSAMSELESRSSIMTARSAAAKAAAGDLNIAETALASASDLMVQAKSVALSMATGTVSASDRANAASQIDAIRSQMLGLANTKGASGYLFGGNHTTTAPFDPNGVFVGDNGTRSVQINETKTTPSTVSGADAFTAANGGRDVLADLAQLSSDLKSNNVTGISTAIDNMTTGNTQLINSRVTAGSMAGTLSDAATTMDNLVSSFKTATGSIGDADLTTAYSSLVASQQSYQAALSVSQRLLAMSTLAQQG